MGAKKTVFVAAAVLLLGLGRFVFAGDGHKYIGIKKCSMCHKSDAKGNQYKQWTETKHAHAYEILKTDAARQTAEEVGVKGDPAQAPECLRCHTTAYGVDAALLDTGFNKEEGVQCEACHGPGGDYAKMNTMKDLELSKQNGLVMPAEEVCVKCHNEENPNYVEFKYEEFKAKIAHPNPQREQKN